VIGKVGTILGENEINIAKLFVRTPERWAASEAREANRRRSTWMAGFPDDVLRKLEEIPAVRQAKVCSCSKAG